MWKLAFEGPYGNWSLHCMIFVQVLRHAWLACSRWNCTWAPLAFFVHWHYVVVPCRSAYFLCLISFRLNLFGHATGSGDLRKPSSSVMLASFVAATTTCVRAGCSTLRVVQMSVHAARFPSTSKGKTVVQHMRWVLLFRLACILYAVWCMGNKSTVRVWVIRQQ